MQTEAVSLGKAEAKFDFATEDASETSLKQGEQVDVIFPSATVIDSVSWVLVKTSSSIGYVPRSYLQVKAAPHISSTVSSAKPLSSLAAEAAKTKPSTNPQVAAPVVIAGAAKTAGQVSTETGSNNTGPVRSTATVESKPSVVADIKPNTSTAPTKPPAAALAPASVEPKPVVAPAVATRKASLDASPSFVAPPATSPFWTNESTAPYAKLLKMGMPIEQVVMKMEREGADTGVLKGAPSAPAGNRDTVPPQPAVASKQASPSPAVAAPQTKSIFKRSSPAPAPAPAPSPAPAPAPIAKKTASLALTGGATETPPVAKPSALLSGIQGFNKTKLKHADTVEKVSVPASASKTIATKPSPGASAPAPAGRPTQGLSLMDEMRARAARRA
jgi:hypothetical protein